MEKDKIVEDAKEVASKVAGNTLKLGKMVMGGFAMAFDKGNEFLSDLDKKHDEKYNKWKNKGASSEPEQDAPKEESAFDDN